MLYKGGHYSMTGFVKDCEVRRDEPQTQVTSKQSLNLNVFSLCQ